MNGSGHVGSKPSSQIPGSFVHQYLKQSKVKQETQERSAALAKASAESDDANLQDGDGRNRQSRFAENREMVAPDHHESGLSSRNNENDDPRDSRT